MKQHHINKQRGATMMLTLVFMIGMLGIIGLAIDTGHILVNKTRLQNALDATALSSAITLNGTSNNSVAESIDAGIATFNLFKNSQGNDELASVTLTAANFLFSDNVSQFLSGVGGTPNFVRVSTNALQVNNFFIQVFTGTPSENVAAISTAGPMGQNCNLVPLVICAHDEDPSTPDITDMDKDCTTDSSFDDDSLIDCYGYNLGEEIQLHLSFKDTELEGGNFTLLRWSDSNGANDIQKSLSGEVNSCSIGVQLETEPGNMVQPVRTGINTRINNDTVTTEFITSPALNEYKKAQVEYPDNLNGIVNNREVAIPIGDCLGAQNGLSTFNFAKDGSGNMAAICALITKKTTMPPNNTVYLEFTTGLCPALGNTDPNNPVIYGPFKIVLFKSENSQDS